MLSLLLFSLLPIFLCFTSAQRPSSQQSPDQRPSSNSTDPNTNTNSTGAVFVYDGEAHTKFIFALNADESTGDLYFHLSSPAGNAWVGVGIGDGMKDSLMFLAYPDSTGHGVTLSPRIADGNVEPSYQEDMKVEKQDGEGLVDANTVSGGRMNVNIIADGVCRGCRSWEGGKIDLEAKEQPFIFALGPSFPPIQSDSPSAGLSRHSFYGHFTMDMTQATSSNGGAVPVGPYDSSSAAASEATEAEYDSDPAPHIHGLVMCIVFVLLLPAGALLLRVWNKVKGHAIVQTFAFVLFLMAFAGGAYISGQYNKSKNFNSAHQILGILLLLAMFLQLGLGVMHHRVFKKEQRKTIMGKIHLYLGPAVIVVGLINGGLGFAFAGNGFLGIPYTIIILLVAAIYGCIRGVAWFRRRRRGGSKGQPGQESYRQPQFGNANSNQQLYGQPDGSGVFPPPYSHDVPLQPYASRSNQSVPDAGMPGTRPRAGV